MASLIWLFTKPNANSSVVSNRLADWLSRQVKAPLVYDEQALDHANIDVLFIVNGAYAFCSKLHVLAQLVVRAQRIIWIQNDYTIVPPKATSNGESPFRAAFRKRRERKLPDMDFWSTCYPFAEATPRSNYVNWNALAYEPMGSALAVRRKYPPSTPTLLYYGAGREGRSAYFDRYFLDPPVTTVISTASKKFRERYGAQKNVSFIDVIPREDFHRVLNKHGIGLYIEDRRSHGGDHSPATRFYEMLSAGLPMVFQPEAVPGLQRAGFDVTEFVFRSTKELKALLQAREDAATAQQRMWGGKEYQDEVKTRVRYLWRVYQRNI